MRFVRASDGGGILILKGRGISRGKATGALTLLEQPFSFLGGVDPKTGRLTIASGAEGKNISNSIFAFPFGRGSTVGSYTLLQMKKEGTIPSAIINENAETIVATGAVMARVPMIDSIDLRILCDGDEVVVDGEEGTLELPRVNEVNVVTCILRHNKKILILKRSQKVATNKGMWAGVSGYIEEGESPLQTAIKEVSEETAITNFELIKSGEMLRVRSSSHLWRIHPYLFELSSPEININWEHTDYRWIDPNEIDEATSVPGFRLVMRNVL
jgi:predicted aconitase with swiveling domain/8-oxo-dGTP pyrophosphatase MutT (NUDIX family)